MNLSTLPHSDQIAVILTASDAALKSAWAARCSSMVKKRSGGPKFSTDRCPCGLMTRDRAAKRKHKCEAPPNR